MNALAIMGSIFYCRSNAEINGSGSLEIFYRFDSDVPPWRICYPTRNNKRICIHALQPNRV